MTAGSSLVVSLSSATTLLCLLHGGHLGKALLDLGDGLAPDLFDFNVEQIVHQVGLLGHRLLLTNQMLVL